MKDSPAKRTVVFYMNPRENAHSKTGYHKSTETEIILKISPSFASWLPTVALECPSSGIIVVCHYLI